MEVITSMQGLEIIKHANMSSVSLAKLTTAKVKTWGTIVRVFWHSSVLYQLRLIGYHILMPGH